MTSGIAARPTPRNEPVLNHAPGTPERRALRAVLARMASERLEVDPHTWGAACGRGGPPYGLTGSVVQPGD